MTTTHFGTGFYTSGDGDIVTAAHVLGNKSWSDAGTGMVISIGTPPTWEVQNSKGVKVTISRDKLEQSPDSWGADLAKLRSSGVPHVG